MAVHPAYLHSKLTNQIINIARQVHAQRGPGDNEHAYRDDLVLALTAAGYWACPKVRVAVRDANGQVTTFLSVDVTVNDCVAVELKALASSIHEEHLNQLSTWLRWNGILAVGLVLNFGSVVQVRRVFEPDCLDARPLKL
ncbi:MAG: GxxExxY protein [Thermoflexales bacterium]|nr:GxxExxY protein [Thermoflexales bacterium]